jgi:dynein heavy chain
LDPQRDELSILVHAIYSASNAQFSEEDSKVFVKFLQEVFPSTFHVISALTSTKSHVPLRELVTHDLELRGLVAVPYFVDKVVQLYEAIKSHRTVIIVGASQAGKSSNYSTLSRVIYQYENSKNEASEIRTTVVHPVVLSASELVGKFEDETNIWRDGTTSKNSLLTFTRNTS